MRSFWSSRALSFFFSFKYESVWISRAGMMKCVVWFVILIMCVCFPRLKKMPIVWMCRPLVVVAVGGAAAAVVACCTPSSPLSAVYHSFFFRCTRRCLIRLPLFLSRILSLSFFFWVSLYLSCWLLFAVFCFDVAGPIFSPLLVPKFPSASIKRYYTNSTKEEGFSSYTSAWLHVCLSVTAAYVCVPCVCVCVFICHKKQKW